MPAVPVTIEVEVRGSQVDVRPAGALVIVEPADDGVAVSPADGARVIFAAARGEPGPRGPAGDGGYSHIQSTPAATWTITHGLGRYPAAVTLWIDDELINTDIETPDVATVVVTFPFPCAGRAEII